MLFVVHEVKAAFAELPRLGDRYDDQSLLNDLAIAWLPLGSLPFCLPL